MSNDCYKNKKEEKGAFCKLIYLIYIIRIHYVNL